MSVFPVAGSTDYAAAAERLRCASMPVPQRGPKIDPYLQQKMEDEALEMQQQLEQDKEELLTLVEEQQRKIAEMHFKTVEAEREKQRISSELSMLMVSTCTM